MTKDVLVKISGLQFAEDQDNGPVEIITTVFIPDGFNTTVFTDISFVHLFLEYAEILYYHLHISNE